MSAHGSAAADLREPLKQADELEQTARLLKRAAIRAGRYSLDARALTELAGKYTAYAEALRLVRGAAEPEPIQEVLL